MRRRDRAEHSFSDKLEPTCVKGYLCNEKDILAGTILQQTKELQHHLLVNWRRVANPIAQIANKLAPITVQDLRVLGTRDTGYIPREWYSKNVRPLFEGLHGAGWANKRISHAVEDLHPGPRSVVAWVAVPDKVPPLSSGMPDLALRARLVWCERGRHRRAGEAGMRRARVRRTGGEDLRV